LFFITSHCHRHAAVANVCDFDAADCCRDVSPMPLITPPIFHAIFCATFPFALISPLPPPRASLRRYFASRFECYCCHAAAAGCPRDSRLRRRMHADADLLITAACFIRR